MYATTKNNEKFIKKVKGFDSTHIPPCWKSLKQKLLRTIFVNSMYQNATKPDFINFSAENSGWLLLDGFLKPTWFVGDSTLLQVKDVVCNSIKEIDENTDYSDISSCVSDSSDESEDA
ncbi:unnamed protein product [Brassicogethes aeneus]|uniref:Uncharacterized protein n=1 Tax=Brassicogethes aeneus TaxID=1431903 RepID=A0A9P0FPD8_BRAAE|nr:unnamed protein product [Brassicogethes aeneus]